MDEDSNNGDNKVIVPATGEADNAEEASGTEEVVDSSYNRVLDYQRYLLHEMTNMVLRQTSYTYQEAWNELVKHRGNYMLVIRNNTGLEAKRPDDESKRSVNQETYRQIREYMDKGSEQFRRQQEASEIVRNLRRN